MIRIKEVLIQNFRGYGKKISFDFGACPLVLFVAPNGVGKTSLLDAIEWCLTGNIQRLYKGYKKRNPNTSEQNKKLNEETILKNRQHLQEKVTVKVMLQKDDVDYLITRIQQEDTLKNPGVVKITTKSGEIVENAFLEQVVDLRNFYKYHVCDMQKTYNFLYNGRNEISEEFIDFVSNYEKADTTIENLNLFIGDIDKKIDLIEKRKISNNTIDEYYKQLKRYEKIPEIFPYSTEKLYSEEYIDLSKMNIDALKQQFLQVSGIGYKRIADILKKQISSIRAVEISNDLKILEQQYLQHKGEIETAIEMKANDASVRQKAEDDLERKKRVHFNTENLEGNSKAIIAFNSAHFTQQYWEGSVKDRKELDENIRKLASEIEVLNRGDEILSILTSITAGKNGLVAYRNKRKSKTDVVLCPVCGSEQFDLIEEDDIAKEAKKYQAEHKVLIEQKRKQLIDLESKKRSLLVQQFEKASMAKKEAVAFAQAKMNELTNLYNQTKEYFSLLEKLQKKDRVAYNHEKLIGEGGYQKAKEELDNFILPKEIIVDMEKELQQIFIVLNGAYEEKDSLEKVLSMVEPKAAHAPKDARYDFELLRTKISSLQTYMKNADFQEISASLKMAEHKNSDCNKQIEELVELSKKAKERLDNIKKILKTLREEEYSQVGPYLYKIFRKLSRDVKIDGLELKSGKGDKQLLLTDEKGKSILNMFSDGQLSVFMLSYFLGNALRLKDMDTFPVYFIDDITSCMDDINMLAFLDFIKYQLSDDNGAFGQVFFATCDSRIQDMFCWKMDSCGILYKKIGVDEFERELS